MDAKIQWLKVTAASLWRPRGIFFIGYVGAVVREIKRDVIHRKMKLWEHMCFMCTSIYSREFASCFVEWLYSMYVHTHVHMHRKSPKMFFMVLQYRLKFAKTPMPSNERHRYIVFWKKQKWTIETPVISFLAEFFCTHLKDWFLNYETFSGYFLAWFHSILHSFEMFMTSLRW